MSVPSMVHRSGDTLVVRSVVSGDALYGTGTGTELTASEESAFSKPPAFLDWDAKDLPECKVKRNYSCAICDFFTQNPRSFLYHLRDVHKEKVKIYECPNCLYASKHFQKLLRHTKMVHGESGDTAPEAPRMVTRKRSIQEEDSGDEFAEVKNVDDEKPVHKCSLCAYVAKTSAQLSKHEKDEHIRTKFFRCTKCTYVTHMKARFTKHVKYHSMPMIKCDMCDFRTPYKWNLDRHCKNHNGRGTFRCSACNFTADIKQSLTVHEMNHHVPPVGQAAGLGVGRRRNKVGASDSTAAEDGIQVLPAAEQDSELVPRNAPQKTNAAKVAKSNGKPETDFVHPDDIVQHANGKVYIKNKCRFCAFKTAWESEMVRHEQQTHADLMLTPPKKKVTRPVPGLLPISLSPKEKRSDQTEMSQTDMEKILASSRNSDLKDFAKLFSADEDMFPTGTTTPQTISFFDKFKANMCDDNLICEHCGHESKYLTEHATHKKSCGKVSVPTPNITSMHKLGSTRCQYCRQRCKSSKDLINHLQTCEEAQKANVKEDDNDTSEPECYSENNNDKKPHPMENKVFIWNQPTIDDNDSTNLYESYMESHQQDHQDPDQLSIDLSIRGAQSPTSESSGSLTNNNNTYEKTPSFEKYYQAATPMVTSTLPTTTDKIPTHGNDISVAQHKRVFKCPHCTFWASTASRFHVHIVGHLNKKPFECSLCAYRSNWRWDITKHIKLKSVRDPAHEAAKVLMTDETGRRNYTKYNKYLTEIPLKTGQEETSGGMGTRPKDKKGVDRSTALRPPPQLKPANEYLNKVPVGDKKKSSGDGKKTYWQCKKCNYRDLCKDKCLHHVRGHVQGWSSGEEKMALMNEAISPVNSALVAGWTTRNSELDSEASFAGGGVARGQAPFRCGHCQQVSNWKHVIQRHCRLKHAGDVKVVMGSTSNLDDSFEQMDVVQEGAFKCSHCPFSSNDAATSHMHLEGHIPRDSATIKCPFCNYYVSQPEDLQDHLVLHGAPRNSVPKEDKMQLGEDHSSKRYKCTTCPYVTNSKSQFTYHKQFHQPKNGQYSCTECSYNVSKRHLLHQHMKVHGITISPQKQNGEVLDLEEITDEMEEVHSPSFDWQNLHEIPLVWVSKAGKFSKMYRCRFCPHVNLRKVNIMEHEKMHGSRGDRNSRCGENEHRCPDCNYVCNNAGVLSSHTKVHQGLYGAVHGLVDSSKTDEEQIRELGAISNVPNVINLADDDTDYDVTDREMLFFCDKCPARFLKKSEHEIHANFHGAGLTNRCENCSYSSHQKAYLQGHNKVHTTDYQERTKTLIECHLISPEHPQPIVVQSNHAWIVEDGSSEEEPDNEHEFVYKRMNVPLSGTDLFQQKSEAEANEGYSGMTMQRIGKVKEKRYKCTKCPSAFEKREQFKLHMGLHGSNQQYVCNFCDYSVSTQANLAQHEKKHRMVKTHEDDMEEVDAITSPPAPRDVPDTKKQYWCSMCPYVNTRRDAVDNHQKRHVKLSGLESNYMCSDCDYSVPQMHVLRDHMKLHFLPNKMHSPDAFMAQDVSEFMIRIEDSGDHAPYSLGSDVESSPLNNNEGEKLYVNTDTGEVGESPKDTKMDTS